MDILSEKVCPKCKAVKPATLEHFQQGKPRVDGTPRLDAWCRCCKRQANRDHIAQNREARNIKQREAYRAKHPQLTKTCSECAATYPYGSNKFSPGKPYCRECGLRRRKEAHERARQAKLLRQALPTRTCSKCQIDHPNTSEFFYPYGGNFCKPCHLQRMNEISRRNPLKIRAKRSARRAKKKAAGGTYSVQDVRRQLAQQKGLCYWCRGKLETKPGENKYHIDHLIALSKGGTNGPENIVCACPTCNLTKSDRTPWDFAGRLL